MSMFFPVFHFFLMFSLALWPLSTAEKKIEPRKASLELPDNSEDFRDIRIFLKDQVSEIKISTDFPFVVRDRLGRQLLSGPHMSRLTVRPVVQGIQLGSQILRNMPIAFESQGSGFRLGEYSYRHILKMNLDPQGKILVINEVPLEDYLKGVLPWEVNPSWSVESLKAQAVASRTYAFFKMLENEKSDYDVRTDTMSQVYKGKGVEKPTTSKAIDATRGQILTHQGKVIVTYFHSTCGGSTADIHKLWDIEEHPSLKGTICNFCRNSRHYRWKNEIPVADIEEKMKKAGTSVVGIRRIKATDKDKGGRAEFVEIEDQKTKRKYRAADFRIWVGADKIKSTIFESIEVRGDQAYFQGRGWGHGGGLCQYGMKRLGELGYHYQQILNYYYPQTDIKQYWSAEKPTLIKSLIEKSKEIKEDLLPTN